jgi:hypothetical protein
LDNNEDLPAVAPRDQIPLSPACWTATPWAWTSIQEIEMEMQKAENRRCELHPAKSKGVHEYPFSYTKHSLIDRTCEGPFRTPPRRSPGLSTVLAGSLLLKIALATIPTLHNLTHHWDAGAEPRVVTATNGNRGRGSVDAEDTDIFIIIRKKRLFLVRDWGLRRRSSTRVLSPEHGNGTAQSSALPRSRISRLLGHSFEQARRM